MGGRLSFNVQQAASISTTIPELADSLGIVWWNVADFYHFDHSKVNKSDKRNRWPISLEAYTKKCARVDAALHSLFQATGTPSILALGEITERAARELRDRLLPGFKLISLDTKKDKPTLQLAIIHSQKLNGVQLKEQPPLVVPNTPRGTRPMAVVDIAADGFRIRCIACHWTARLEDESQDTRDRIADYLSVYTYDFLVGNTQEKRNIVIFGDLNEEPHGNPQNKLHAHRHRALSQKRLHYADKDVKRIHLYNCSWRLLGEKHAHSPVQKQVHPDVAGTHYWEAKHSWHNVDQLIVSGGLLGSEPPFLDEQHVAIGALPEFVPEGIPVKFSFENGVPKGLSDHLPIVAKLQLRNVRD